MILVKLKNKVRSQNQNLGKSFAAVVAAAPHNIPKFHLQKPFCVNINVNGNIGCESELGLGIN